MDISLKMLRYFKKVAETRHLTNAAKQLYISQPQLTRIINELEETLGVRLFDRDGRGIKLNACGQAFYRYALEILALAEKAQETVREIHLHEQAHLTIASNVVYYLPPVLRLFREQCPQTKVRQITALRDQISYMLMDRRADFALYCFPLDTPELTSELVFQDIPVILYPEGHHFSEKKSVTIEEIAKEPMIFVPKGLGPRDTLDYYYRDYTFNYAVETMESIQVLGYVNENVGIAPMPLSSMLLMPEFKARCAEVENPPTLDMYLVWRTDKVFSETDRIFVEVVRSHFARLTDLIRRHQKTSGSD